MTKLTNSSLDFRKPPKKAKDRAIKALPHRPTLIANKNDKIGDPKYGPVDNVRTVEEVEAELDLVNKRIANFDKKYDDPRRYANKEQLPPAEWKDRVLNALKRKRDTLINELASLHSSQKYDRKPMSSELTYYLKSARRLQRQIESLPAEFGPERTDLIVPRLKRHLEDLQEKIRLLLKSYQPYGDAEVDDEVQDIAEGLFEQWRQSKQA